ncbi:MAG TPA: hypothetical protein VNS34_28645 [Rhizobiaceae bacterium]|nr:hypothetical protein [Rhizobiaceae bacterium]
MNVPLSRIIEGIIATMRSDVIPHVSDSYARGQAVGVIDLLNNIAPRVEWAQLPLLELVEAKRRLLEEIARTVPDVAAQPVVEETPATAEGLLVLRGRLDAAICDAIAFLWPRRHEPDCGRAAGLIQAHLHDEMTAEMKITRKPLFAEIASGDGAKA